MSAKDRAHPDPHTIRALAAVPDKPEPRIVPVKDTGLYRGSGCGRYIPASSDYTNRCSDCWTREDDFI